MFENDKNFFDEVLLIARKMFNEAADKKVEFRFKKSFILGIKKEAVKIVDSRFIIEFGNDSS